MDNLPLVSILCISMNHAEYVKQSFDSIVQQTYKNIEIIYVDNNSSDQSFEIANEIFLKSGLPYKGFKREKNYNIPENLNFLLSHCKGKYIAPQSGDDWWELSNIEEKIKFYEKSQEFGLVYCNGYLYNNQSGEITQPDTSKYKSGLIFDSVLLEGIYFPIGYVMRKDVFDTIGLYDEDIMVDDWDIWLRILRHFPIGYFDKPLVYYRRHPSTFYLTANFNKHIVDTFKTLNKYNQHPYYKKAVKNTNKNYIYSIVNKQNYKVVIKEILRVGTPNWFYAKQLFKVVINSLFFFRKNTSKV